MLELTMGDTHVVSIHGRAGLTIGDKVHIDHYQLLVRSHKGEKKTQTQGDFLITQLRHSFTQEPEENI